MSETNLKILNEYFDNDKIFFKDQTYRQFLDEVKEKSSQSSSSKICLIEYDPTRIKSFLNRLFKIFLDDKIALIVHHSEPRKKTIIDSANKKYLKSGESFLSRKPCLIIRTSGSSGNPKNVLYCLESLVQSAKDTILHYGLKNHEIWGCTLPLNHIGGLMILFRTIVLQSEFTALDPSRLETSDLSNLDYISLVPTQLKKILSTGKDLSNLKGVVLGGAKVNTDDLSNFIKADIKIATSYGMSETCAQVCSTPFTKDLKLLKTSGIPMGKNKILIKDGRITIESKRLALGYLDGTLFHNVFETQDLGEIDKDGNILINGRIDDVIISGGENINLNEISNNLEGLFKNTTVLTLGVEDDYFGEVPYSIIHGCNPKLARSEREIKDSLIGNTRPFEVPKKVFFHQRIEKLSTSIKITKKEKDLLHKKVQGFSFLQKMKLNCLHVGDITKKPLFIFHGFMGTHKDMVFFLEDKDIINHHHLILIDLPFHGHTNEKHNYHSINEFCEEFANHLNMNNIMASYIGYSLGGRIAYGISKNLNIPSSFILESSSIGIKDPQDKKERREKDKNFMKEVDTEQDFLHKLNEWYSMNIFKGLTRLQKEELINSKEYRNLGRYKEAAYFYSPSHQEYIQPKNINRGHQYHYIYGEDDQKYKELSHEFDHSYSIEHSSHNTHYMNNLKYLSTIKMIILK